MVENPKDIRREIKKDNSIIGVWQTEVVINGELQTLITAERDNQTAQQIVIRSGQVVETREGQIKYRRVNLGRPNRETYFESYDDQKTTSLSLNEF